MKQIEKCKELFIEALRELKYNNINNESRKLSEVDYFEAYLEFLNNSIHYSRFSYSIKGKVISGKYLNEKVNKWARAGLINKIYEYVIKSYKSDNTPTKCLYIDGHIVTNRYGVGNVGRCVYYKSKNGYNIQSIVDDKGVSLGVFIKGANENEGNMLTDTVNASALDDANKYKNSKRYNQYFIADAGYDYDINREFLSSKGFTPLIWANKRNTKDSEKLKKKKLTKNQKKHYKTRHIIENSFSWMETKIPRLSKIYDKYISNYLNTVYISIIDIILSRKCV